MNNFPLEPLLDLPLSCKTYPPLLHLCPSAFEDTFILLFLICNVYILHRLTRDHISYLHYTSLN
jgi:hypothetical protein